MKFLIALVAIAMFSIAQGAETLIIGIAGGTGSGKTTLARKIQKAIAEHSVLVSQDFYYKDLSDLQPEERDETNFDHPDSLDFQLMGAQIMQLKREDAIHCPQYDFITHTRTSQTKLIEPARVIIVEGILIFAIPDIRNLFDCKIFIDTDDDVRLLRRMERDILERGRDFDSVKNQYLKTVKPMHDAFVEPSKQYADIIVPHGGDNPMALSFILSRLKEQIHGEIHILQALE